MKKRLFHVFIMLSTFVLVSCMPNSEVPAKDIDDINSLVDDTLDTLSGVEKSNFEVAWSAYWSYDDVLSDMSDISHSLESIVIFAAYFDSDGDIFIPDELEDMNKHISNNSDIDRYISITNDVQNKDGTAVQKSIDLLSDKLQTSEIMRELSDDLIDLAKDMDAVGIEVDFENFKQKPELWYNYVDFIEVLWQKCVNEGLELRIILSVDFPEEIVFPLGPDYDVMLYNLYGTHSGPGPKADIESITNWVTKCEDISNAGYALATGGFEWDEDDNVTRSLTQIEAEELIEQHDAKVLRDEDSAALYFTYRYKGDDYTVWYADNETLINWQQAVTKISGENTRFSLWKLGGNDLEN